MHETVTRQVECHSNHATSFAVQFVATACTLCYVAPPARFFQIDLQVPMGASGRTGTLAMTCWMFACVLWNLTVQGTTPVDLHESTTEPTPLRHFKQTSRPVQPYCRCRHKKTRSCCQTFQAQLFVLSIGTRPRRTFFFKSCVGVGTLGHEDNLQ